MNKEARISSLMEKGFSYLGSHRYSDALAVGRRLKRLRHSSAFEIIALAHLRLGALPKAIAVLEEGIAKAARVWLLWELLGNCYSDAGRYKAAERAYKQALTRDRCDADVVHLNRAIAFNRAGNIKKAWSAIQKVKSPRLARHAVPVRIRLQLAFGNKRTAARLALELSRRRVPKVDLDPLNESFLLATCSLALSIAGHRRKARNLAFRSAVLNPQNTEALSLIREIDGKCASGTSLYQLLIRGTWNEPFGRSKIPPGFFRSCQVAAPDESTAFRLAKQFFPPEVRSCLAIEECKIMPRNDIKFDGIYSIGALMFFRRRT
jgi:tetratricopeptide (TPR) repeat protein